MKKLFFIAALGVAGLMSANHVESTETTNLRNTTTLIGGYCHIDVYRTNQDGSQTYIGSWGGYADSQEACDAKGRSITAQLSMSIPPEDVVA